MKKMLEFLLEWKEYIISYNQNPFHINDIKEIKDIERVLINAPENVEITIQLILKNFRIANIYITPNPETEFDIDYYEFVEKLKD